MTRANINSVAIEDSYELLTTYFKFKFIFSDYFICPMVVRLLMSGVVND